MAPPPTPITTFTSEREPYLDNLKRLVNGHYVEFDPNTTTLVARGKTLIGWLNHGFILPLFDGAEKMVIYNFPLKQRFAMTLGQIRQMGVFRRLRIVPSQDAQVVIRPRNNMNQQRKRSWPSLLMRYFFSNSQSELPGRRLAEAAQQRRTSVDIQGDRQPAPLLLSAPPTTSEPLPLDAPPSTSAPLLLGAPPSTSETEK